MQRGQTSAEMLIILSVSLVAILAIFSVTNQLITELNNQKLVEQAQTEVNELRDAVNDVYSQGVGARKKVFFNVPNGVDDTSSGIREQSLVLSVLGSDVFARTDVTITGTLPTEFGGHEIWVTAFENYVAIGTQNVSLDKTSSFVTLSQSDNQEDNVTITNTSSTDTNITIVKNWSNTDVTLSLSASLFQLNAGQQQIVTLSFVSNSSASGNYVGSLDIGANFSNGDENINLPINAEVTAPVGGDSLVILPLSKTIDLDAGASDINSFQICNNTVSTISNIDFTDSGTIADWIDPITSITSLTSGECQSPSFTVTVPGGQSSGAFTGTITATDDSGSGTNTDSISLTINVTSAIPSVPTLGNVDVIFFSDAGYSINSEEFLRGETVYYEIRTYDVNTDIIEITDLNIQVIDPNVVTQQNLIGLSTTLGVYQGSYTLGALATAGSWTVNADANRNSTISDSNNFNVTVPSVPTLGNVDVILFSDGSYTTNSQNFQQGETVYYEIRTFDVNLSIIEITDLNIQVIDPSVVTQQNLTGLSTTLGVYQGSYTLGGGAETGSWTVNADANRNTTISDSNTFTVTAVGECANQAACFAQSWNSSTFTCVGSGNPNNRYCQLSESSPFWTIQNTSSGTTITIARIMVTWTGDTDGETDVDDIVINNIQRNVSASASGVWNDITDFSLSAGQSMTTNNWLRWQGRDAGNMDNETETYTLQFEFTDASTFTTTSYNPA